MPSPFNPNIIVVGAGPSGLLLTLLLARLHTSPLLNNPSPSPITTSSTTSTTNPSATKPPKPIHILLLDQASSLDTNPRATHYGGPAMSILARAGVGDDMRRTGFTPDTVCWRKLNGERIAGISFSARSLEKLSSEDGVEEEKEKETGMVRMVCLPLSKLGRILVEHLKEYEEKGVVKVEWGRSVVGVGQDEKGAWVEVETDRGREKIEAEYVVGCDGANSVVRRCLFGKGEDAFPGKTWDEQIVATNTYYDFSPFGWEDSNFIIDPVHWYMAAKITTDGMWRITYGELPGLTNEELKERQPMKFEGMLPGRPAPDKYKVVNFSPYRVHQRLAKRMRVGRVLLAADAAHLCNPFGGMGLTSGIVDVGGLYDCFHGIYSGLVSADFILEKYHEVRSEKFHKVINPISSANIVRLFGQNPDKALESDPFLQMCKQAETDKKVQEQFARAAMALSHDFGQYYDSEGSAAAVNGSATRCQTERDPNNVNMVTVPVAVID